ncbi:MAG TPA: cytochrome c [Chthonomonadaceae bacterium]|nr:cytochrome c [Chthonomonadaceae bacterium]
MISVTNRATALVLAGLYTSLLATAALAAPPKSHHKPPPKKGASANASLVSLGKKVYAQNGCANCHTVGDKGGKNGPNLTKTGAESKHTVAWFEEQIKNPKMHDDDSTMPPFGDRIKGKDLTALATYLKSLK